jgi:hypothetical protein
VRPSVRGLGGVAAAAAAAVVVTATVLLALIGDPSALPAGADTGSAGAGSGGGTVTVGAGSGSGTGGSTGGSSGGSPSGGAGTSSPWECTYTYLALNNEGGFPPGGALPGAWYSVTCDDPATGAQVTQTVWITGAPPSSTPQVDPRTVALQAERSMTLPAPSLRSNPVGSSVVGLVTWLWVDPALWQDHAETATAGGVSATAVAHPVGITWTTGDGAQVECGGPGVPYAPDVAADAQSTYCSHVYARTSLGQPTPDGDPDDGRYPVSATVEWTVSWTAVGAAGGGVLPTLYTTGASSLRVVQVESLNSVVSPLVAGRRAWIGGGP